MAREHARLLLRINQDQEFNALGPLQQWLYFRIIALPSLNNAGVFDVSVKKLVRLTAGVDREQIEDALRDLSTAGFLVFDDELDEAVVRSYMRNDGAPKQPKLMIAAARAARQATSPKVRSALAVELARMLPAVANDDASREVRDALAALDPSGQIALPEGSPSAAGKGIANPTGNPSQVTLPEEPIGEPVDLPDVEGEGEGGPSDDDHSRNVSTHFGSDDSSSDPSAGCNDDGAADEESDPTDTREDVEQLCRHLVDRLVANGVKRPRITKTWRREARLLLDSDGRDATKAHRLIDWCQDHHWWRSRVHSMTKFRADFDSMRQQANAAYERRGSSGPRRSTSDDAAASVQTLRRNPRPGAVGQQTALPAAGGF